MTLRAFTTRKALANKKAKLAMGTPNQLGTVAFIKQDLLARGIIPDPQTSNCDSAEITIRVAWATRSQGAMLILKTLAENGCQKLGHPKVGHDSISYGDGYVDCLVGAGPPENTNTPAWQWHPLVRSTTTNLVAPWDLDAGVPEPPQPPEPPTPEPPDDDAATVTEMALAITVLAQDIAHQREEIAQMRKDLATLNDVLELDMQSLGTALVRIEDTQQRGLGGTVLNWKVRLLP